MQNMSVVLSKKFSGNLDVSIFEVLTLTVFSIVFQWK